jgi:hypothetical protein
MVNLKLSNGISGLFLIAFMGQYVWASETLSDNNLSGESTEKGIPHVPITHYGDVKSISEKTVLFFGGIVDDMKAFLVDNKLKEDNSPK